MSLEVKGRQALHVIIVVIDAEAIECIAISKERNSIIDASKFDDQDRKRATLV